MRERHQTILGAFAPHAQEHPGGVQIGNLQAPAFIQTQGAGINGGQAGPINGRAHGAQNLLDFLAAQDHGQLVGFGRAEQFEAGPVSLEGVLEEEFDGAQGDGGGGAGDFLLQGQVQELLA